MIRYFIHYSVFLPQGLGEGNTIVSTETPIATIDQIRGIEASILDDARKTLGISARGVTIRNFIRLDD